MSQDEYITQLVEREIATSREAVIALRATVPAADPMSRFVPWIVGAALGLGSLTTAASLAAVIFY